MAKRYLVGECIAFCLEFLKTYLPVLESANQNEDVDLDEHILEGRPILKAKKVTLSDKELCIAHRYVLMNTTIVNPYIEMHLQELQDNDVRCRRNQTVMWKFHGDRFSQWLKEKIPSNSKEHSLQLRWLAFGPRHTAQTYNGSIVNGHHFHTECLKWKTQNSGVAFEAFTMCRSSVKDTNHVGEIVSYLGEIQEIILMDYHFFQVPLFKCKWASKGNGLKEENGFTLLNFSVNQATFLQDPYIMPSQEKQVFYSRENESSLWSVVMRAPPRGYHELESEEEFVAAPISIEDNDDLGDDCCDDESFVLGMIVMGS